MLKEPNDNNGANHSVKRVKSQVVVRPNPIRIEFEVTNFCNARCEFCPRFNVKHFGLMELEPFQNMIIKLKKLKKNLWINQQGEGNRPIIVFGGYGEALLHPKIDSFISFTKEQGFQTELITNCSILDERNLKRLNDSGLDQLSISLHTLDPKVNKQIGGLDDVIPNVKRALEFFDNKEIDIQIWRVAKLDGTNYVDRDEDQAYKKMLSVYKKRIPVFGPTPAWNRGGQFESKYYSVVRDSKDIRCHILYFTLSISFDGDMVMCCCDFSTKAVKLAEHWNFDFKKIQEKIIYLTENPPKMCLKCRRPKVNYLDNIDINATVLVP